MVTNQAHNTIVNKEHDILRDARKVILTDLNGSPYVSTGSGSGGGDSSAANQLTIIAELQNQTAVLNQNGQVLFGETDIAIAADILIVNYTVPVGKEFKLSKIMCGGNGNGLFRVDVGGTIAVKRNNVTRQDVDFDFPSDMAIAAGDVISVFCLNNSLVLSHFEASIFGKLITL